MSFTNTGYDRGEGEEVVEVESNMERNESSHMERRMVSEVNGMVESKGDCKVKICVMGSGDFGRALAGRLAASGYPVSIASRNPDKNRSLIPSGVEVSGLSSAACADLIIVAVPMDFYHTLPANLLKGKVVVDVSNRSTIKAKTTESQAEQLARLLPESSVVKSFNVLSAYSLESGGMQGSKQVFVAGDDVFARDLVSGVVRGAGFTPVDLGCLSAARTIEDIPVAVFPQWRVPFYIHLSIFTFIYILGFVKFQICWPITWSADGKFLWHLWNHIPMDNTNKALAVHALTTLALCYLPGVLAGWLQIYRGTKYSRFPAWLDNWLKMRKQLGLLMLFAASIHACLSVAYMSPTYQGLVYGDPVEASAHVMEGAGWGPKTESLNRTTIKVFGTEKMKWRGECFLMTGVFGFALVVLLGISSLPSVTATLSWKEFAFVQSGLGWTALVFLCAHDMFYGWPYMNGPSCGIPSSFQYALYIPFLTILMKLPMVLPPLSTHLARIRAGYVRAAKQEEAV